MIVVTRVTICQRDGSEGCRHLFLQFRRHETSKQLCFLCHLRNSRQQSLILFLQNVSYFSGSVEGESDGREIGWATNVFVVADEYAADLDLRDSPWKYEGPKVLERNENLTFIFQFYVLSPAQKGGQTSD